MRDKLSFDAVASDLGVSTASIRNWVKCGYLKVTFGKTVCPASLNNFRNKIAGKEKLVARANKSYFDEHDHQDLSTKILNTLRLGESSVDLLSNDYENNLSQSYRNKEGIYYTPKNIADDFFLSLPGDFSKMTFYDPCCGTGIFLTAALDAGFSPRNVYGSDIDNVAIKIAKQRMYEKTGMDANIVQGNFFNIVENYTPVDRCYDVIITNPPWGNKIPKDEKQRLASFFSTGKNTDTSSLFLMASLSIIKDGGFLGMLMPESFFNVLSFSDVRRRVLEQNIISMMDYGKPFKSLVTKAKGIILKKQRAGNDNFVTCSRSNFKHQRLQSSFSCNPNFLFNLSITQDEHALISHVLNISHVVLRRRARWGLGVVTGNNKKFVKHWPCDGYIPIHIGSDIHNGRVSEATRFISDDFSLYQQVAPIGLYHAESKIIYRFISSNLVFFHDTEKRQILNSANLLIPNNDFPVRHSILAQYLSSKFVSWLHKSLFDSHKILRSDLEKIPVFHEFLDGCKIFNENQLMKYLGIEEVGNGTYRVKK